MEASVECSRFSRTRVIKSLQYSDLKLEVRLALGACSLSFHSPRDFSLMDSDNSSPLEFIFLGTGTSSSLPHLDCLTAPPEKKPCRTCLSTLTPDGKKNIRRNTSGVMRIKGKDGKMA